MTDATHNPATIGSPAPPPPMPAGLSLEALREHVTRARHDLRFPLGHILGFTEMLVEEARNRGFYHFVADFEAISESANQMIAEISQRLGASAVESGLENPIVLRKQIKSLASKIVHTSTGLSHMAQALKEDVFSPDLLRIASSAKELLELTDTVLGFWPQSPPGSDTLARADSKPTTSTKPRSERPTAVDPLFQPGKEGTILVVDDLEANRDLLVKRLSRLGYKVEIVENGRQALDFVAGNCVDLILLDVVMPELDGFQTLAALKDNAATRYVPVIMLSIADDAGTVVQCIKLGADDFLPMPFNTTLLLARIESALAKKRLREINATQPSFYFDKGTLQPTSPSYVERQADKDLLQAVLNNEFCYVLTSRQMGKSSLMARTASKLREQGINVVALDLTAIGQNLTPEQWYDGLVIRLGRQLRLEDELEDFWMTHERLSPVQRFFTALRDVAMQHHHRPLVVFVDELDTVRSLPFNTDEFFAAIRECYNRRSEDAEFQRLSFCLLGVARPSDLIRNARTTPLNVARRVELLDFTPEESRALAAGLRREDKLAETLLRRVLYWTNGHPYLTQRFCRAVAEDGSVAKPSEVDRLCHKLFLSSRARDEDDNLQFVRKLLLRAENEGTSLLKLYRRVRLGKKVVRHQESNPLIENLRLSGIVRIESGYLAVRNRIYHRVFGEDWIEEHLELSRNRER